MEDADAAVLDIGEDLGAMVLYTPEALLGREVEVESDDERRVRTHAVVRARHLGGRQLFSAVFPALAAGRYRICARGVPAMVTIAGGEVTEAHWPGMT
ncbi:MAG TPA: hypothetical protein VG476_14640 [Acidimicrobiales bacterium]|nr:hypothetical protein [Acidimicrobiales bacterium]